MIEESPNEKFSVLKNIFNKDFIISAIIPAIIFYLFSKNNLMITGSIISGLWCISVITINFITTHEINALALIGAIFTCIGLVCTIISKNPLFYLISPIIQDILFAFIFFGSLLFKRSLIQIVAEQSYLKNASDKLKQIPKYESAWRILTILWGFINISYAVFRIMLLNAVSTSAYYAISTVYSNISTPIFIAFSIMFPKWYWTR